MLLFGVEHGLEPCPSCMQLMGPDGDCLRAEMVLPVAEKFAPLSHLLKSKKSNPHRWTSKQPLEICFDCAAAEGLMRFLKLNFYQARVATGNDRQEMLRLPGVRIGTPFTRPSGVGDLDTLLDWQLMTIGNDESRDIVRADAKLELI